MTRTWCLAVLILGVLVAAPNAQGQTKKISFAITDLGELPSPDTNSRASGINNSEQIVGAAWLGTEYEEACIWERIAGQWTWRDLGASQLYDNRSYALEINEWGEIVGSRNIAPFGEPSIYQAYFCDAVGPIDLWPGAPHIESNARDVNDYGQVVGSAGDDAAVGRQACLWQRDDAGVWTFVDLGATTNCYRSYANGINNSAQVVGLSYDESVDSQATLWERDETGQWTMTLLAPGDRSSQAIMINDLGQVVGHHIPHDSTAQRACMWERVDGEWITTILEDNALGLYGYRVWHINDVGQVVGYARKIATNEYVAFLYDKGIMYDLNDLHPAGSQWRLNFTGASCNND